MSGPSQHFQSSLCLVQDSSQGKTASRLEGNEKGTDEKRWPAASEPIKTGSRFVIAAKIIFCTTAREIRSPTLSHPGSEREKSRQRCVREDSRIIQRQVVEWSSERSPPSKDHPRSTSFHLPYSQVVGNLTVNFSGNDFTSYSSSGDDVNGGDSDGDGDGHDVVVVVVVVMVR
ncbi:hypothetical protein V1478_009391 [Vespula squamosa]|uniref:Uncharacterized protein n=1 Tax=Vespula squamosa TaxID=30214 RepID=A0ABD2APJ3_VESSQ